MKLFGKQCIGVYLCNYHFVWISKRGKPVLVGAIKTRFEETDSDEDSFLVFPERECPVSSKRDPEIEESVWENSIRDHGE